MQRQTIDIAIDWQNPPRQATIRILHGELIAGRMARGDASFADGRLSDTSGAPVRLELRIDAHNLSPGANPTLIQVRAESRSFSFLARDVSCVSPIYIPAYGVAVLAADDARNFDKIREDIASKGWQTTLQHIDAEPEGSFEEAAKHTRVVTCPMWLGVSRDVRIFEFNLRAPMQVTDTIQPRFHGYGYFWPEPDKQLQLPRYGFVCGRGWECADRTSRRLDDGVLPILRMTRVDDDVRYEMTAFTTFERSSLSASMVRGTDYLVADGLAVCHAFTEAQEKEFQARRDGELNQNEETVFCARIVAINTANVPRYAFFKAIHPVFGLYASPAEHDFDGRNGFGKAKETGLVFGVSKLDGRPMPQGEIAVLVPAGGSCVYEFVLPHRPVSEARATAIANRDWQSALAECRTFWREKLDASSRVSVPEKRIDEMFRAGLLQLDLVTYGREPDGPLMMASGTYGQVCSEIWENISFFDSLGLHEIARRALQSFLEKQHESGFIQNFTGYMLDTGCVLFGLAEHYRYTRDDAWAKSIAENVRRASRFLMNWREQNCRDDLRGRGFGLMEGKVADPEDNERIYMLNAFAYAGLRGAAILLEKIDQDFSRRVGETADQLKSDLRTAFFESLATGPVIPLADGTWVPTAAPWVGPNGPVSLFLDGKSYWTHGSMTVRDDILGPIHLISRNVLDPSEQASTFVLNFSTELLFSRNVASSQPYYLQHPLVHLLRGEVKPFLKNYYSACSALADRQTYSWWEHFFHVSPHKTHETAGFLMQTRHMLWLESGTTLKLLSGIPRAWMESGKRIELRNVASFFGRFSLSVISDVTNGTITARLDCDPARRPERIEIRLPHPLGQAPSHVVGGRYDHSRETVTIDDFSDDNFTGAAEVCVHFAV